MRYALPAGQPLARRSLVALILTLVAYAPADALPLVPMPTHPPIGLTHFNLAGAGPLVMPSPSLFLTGFADLKFVLAEPWHWENEVNNPNAFAVAFNAIFFAPGLGVRSYIVGLPAGWSAYWDFDFAEIPEVAAWRFVAFNFTGFTLLFDSTVREDPPAFFDVFVELDPPGGAGGFACVNDQGNPELPGQNNCTIQEGFNPQLGSFGFRVPLPASLGLLAAGLLLLAGRLGRVRKA